jgi:hypothetical protein
MTAEFIDPGASKHQSTKGKPVVMTPLTALI